MRELDQEDLMLEKERRDLNKLLFRYISEEPMFCSKHIYESSRNVFKDITGINLTHSQVKLLDRLVRGTRDVFLLNPRHNFKDLFGYPEYSERYTRLFGGFNEDTDVPMTDYELNNFTESKIEVDKEKYVAKVTAINDKYMSGKVLNKDEIKVERGARKHQYFYLVSHLDMFNKSMKK